MSIASLFRKMFKVKTQPKETTQKITSRATSVIVPNEAIDWSEVDKVVEDSYRLWTTPSLSEVSEQVDTVVFTSILPPQKSIPKAPQTSEKLRRLKQLSLQQARG